MSGKLDIEKLIINSYCTIKEAMSAININGLGIIFITLKEKLIGSLTDGDIRRFLISGGDISSSVLDAMNSNPHFIDVKKASSGKTEVIPDFGNIVLPIVDANNKITDIRIVFDDGRIISFNEEPNKFKEASTVNTVALIGGAGYLGSVLSRQLLDKGYKVNILDNLLYGSEGIDELILDKNFTHINGSMETVGDIIQTIKDADAVVHLGAIVGDPASAIDPSKTLSINLHSTKLVADICKFYNINRFIFASTCSVYGKNEGNEGITEEASMNPVSLYARTKIESEKILHSMADGQFSPTILRFSTLFGMSDRMRFDLVVNILCAKAFYDNKITIFGGQQFRPLLSTHDASRSIIATLESKLKNVSSEVFNVGSTDLNFRIIEIGEMINKKLPDAVLEVTENDEDTRDYNVSFEKIRKVLGFKTVLNLEQGIDEIIASFQAGHFKNYQDKKYSNYLSLTD